MALRDIKQKIESVRKTAKVTRAMESVSAVKMRRAQEEALAARPYTHEAFNILKRLAGMSKINLDQMYDFHKKKDGRICIVLITSSKGLAGALNTNVFKKVFAILDNNEWTPENTDFICIGKKGADFVKRKKYTVLHSRDHFDDNDAGPVLEEISGLCLDLFDVQGYREVRAVYTNFITTSEQHAVSRLILPIKYNELHNFIHEIIPKRGRYSDIDDTELEEKGVWIPEYLCEPGPDQLIKDLVPHLLYIGLYHSLLESKASEHSARMVAMKNATDKADELAHDLNRVFNKARQAAITSEISEIVGGMGDGE